jgi:hypothetical protein
MEGILDLRKIVSDLESERDRLSRAIAALEGTSRAITAPKGAASGVKRPRKRRGGITAAGRKRLSEAMKKRWTQRRKKKNGDWAGPRMK